MPSGTSEPSAAGPTVMVLDDDPAILRTIARTLRLYDYRVLEAQSLSAALAVLDQHPEPIDVLLCDLVLPGLGGREAANTLLARRPDTRVMYMSGYSSHDSFRRELEVEGEAFLGKPFEIHELLDAIQGLLSDSG